jgi:hypothetical protein
MDESWDSASDTCHCCDMYRARIRELEKINDIHRSVNGELREVIAEWTSTNTNKPMEKE